MGEAAEHVRKVAKDSLKNIQTYFEEREVNTNFEKRPQPARRMRSRTNQS